MRLVVVGASGRMGRMLIQAVAEAEGCTLSAAIEREGSPALGQDAGVLAGLAPLGVPVTDDPLPAFAEADGVLDFTAPAATVFYAELAAQARIVHVVGTTGLSPDDFAKLKAASYHARIVQSGNMSLGVNLLAGWCARSRRPWATNTTSRSWRCTTATRWTRPPARRCSSARRRRKAGAWRSPSASRGARRPYRPARARHDRLCDAARRQRGRRAQRDLRRRRRAHRAHPSGERPRPVRRRAVKAALWRNPASPASTA